MIIGVGTRCRHVDVWSMMGTIGDQYLAFLLLFICMSHTLVNVVAVVLVLHVYVCVYVIVIHSPFALSTFVHPI